MRRAMAGLIIAFAAFPTNAADLQAPVALVYGANLAALCRADKKSGEYAMCWSYVGAVLEIVNNNSIYGLKVCVPPLINIQKEVNITTKWLDGHPSADIKPASLLTTEALAAAFPCAK